ncbi:hypothetical protein [Flavobacterium sp. AG291]|uniref:hypothetical protein n=1 Tax=Flavobacterium sp. AG291 TaxID=2184000 RepID=UPI000E0B2A36|nr:hypothetical protein [Flavobacterium sp. AG291]RDI07052.1 hypothetical protein DEU42_113152 [Flavobacterium sp. AG291]
MSDIDALLWRKIKDGKQYDKLIPPSNCTSKDVGKGMTDLSVKEMAEMVKISLIDTAAIAPLFLKSSLKETCAAIYGFVYDHFQYKADKAIQYLRSPSCSWKVRYDGIDCKSYSIIASSILTNLGLTHYIRQIKQPGFMPEMWTHVYIVVPVDQKTGSLSKGHYTIDGTVATMNEPMYIQKSDLKMSLQHYALRGAVHAGSGQGLGISLSTVKSMFSNGWAPSCIGGVHDMTDFDKTLAAIAPYFDDALYSVNDAIRNNNSNLFALINDLLKNTQQIQAHSLAYSKHSWNSKCSKDSTAAYRDLGQWYYNIIMVAFIQWLEQYFDVTYTTLGNVQQGQFKPDSWFTKTSFAGVITVKQLATIKMKSTTTEIKRFEITPYVQDKKNQTSFNIFQFLGGLSQTLASFNNPTPTQTTTPTATTVKTPISTIKFTGDAVKLEAQSMITKADLFTKKDNNVSQNALGTVGKVLIASAVGYGIYKVATASKSKAKVKSK